MNTKKFFIGGIAGGVVYFLLGWLLYGMLLSDFMKSSAGIERAQDSMIFWSLILGNLLLGFLLSYVLNRSGAASVSDGLGTGFLIGLLFAAGFDLIMYGTTTLVSLKQVAADVATFAVISAIAGAVIALVARPRVAVATA
jgi:hypothetical protein